MPEAGTEPEFGLAGVGVKFAGPVGACWVVLQPVVQRPLLLELVPELVAPPLFDADELPGCTVPEPELP